MNSNLLMEGFYNQVKSLMKSNHEEPNYDDNYKCFCNSQIICEPFDELYNHISQCKIFLKESIFYKEFEKLRLNIFKLPQLLALKAELLYIINEIDEYINKKQQQQQVHSPQNSQRHTKQNSQTHSQSQFYQKYNPINQRLLTKSSKDLKQINRCNICGIKENNENEMESIFSLQQCQHIYCLGCIKKWINQQYTTKSGYVDCKVCKKQIEEKEIEQIIGKERLIYLKIKIKTGSSPVQSQLQCQFCQKYVQMKDIKPGKRIICDQKECNRKNQFACQKLQSCKHYCCGYKDEKTCIGCLSCKNTQQSQEFCSICFTECLYEAPCIQSICGHIYHYECVKMRLQKKWTSIYISFGFCVCSLCKKWMDFPKDSECQNMMNECSDLLSQVKKQASLRMGKYGDGHILKVEEALEVFAFYQCYQCKKPYFGGKKDCQLELEAEQIRQNNSELVCPSCCGQQINGCKDHGTDYLEYKCKYCCNIATYFCWGTTHFCQGCHTKQSVGKYLTQMKQEELPKCLGNEKCPIGGNHAPNGQEQCLGCALCNNRQI